jgi:hypothetical protein
MPAGDEAAPTRSSPIGTVVVGPTTYDGDTMEIDLEIFKDDVDFETLLTT